MDSDERHGDEVPCNQAIGGHLAKLWGHQDMNERRIFVSLNPVRFGRTGRAPGVGVIGANDLKTRCSSAADGREMGSWIDLIPPQTIRSHVRGSHHVNYFSGMAEQQPAALFRCGLDRVLQHPVVECRRHADDVAHTRSITIAVPIPPPMHNDATPYRAPLS